MLGTKTKSDGKVSAELMARVVDEVRVRSSELAEATSAAGRYRPAGKLSAPAYLEACLQRAGHGRGPLEALQRAIAAAPVRFESLTSLIHTASEAIEAGWWSTPPADLTCIKNFVSLYDAAMGELALSGVVGVNGFTVLALAAEDAGRRAPHMFGEVGSLDQERAHQRELAEAVRVAEARWNEVPEELRLGLAAARQNA